MLLLFLAQLLCLENVMFYPISINSNRDYVLLKNAHLPDTK